MINDFNKENLFIKIILILISLVPFFLLSGPFIADFLLSLISIYTIILIIVKKEWVFIKNPLIYLLTILYLFILFRTFYENFYNADYEIQSNIFYFRFIFFITTISYWIYKFPLIINFLKYTLPFLLFFVIIDGLMQYYIGYNIFGILRRGDRIGGFFGEELILGSYVSRWIPLALALLFFFHFNKKRYLNFVSIFIITAFILIYLTGERAAFIIFCLSLILFFIYFNKLEFSNIISIFLIVLIIFLITLYTQNSHVRMYKTTLDQLGLNSNDKNFFDSSYGKIYFSAYKIFLQQPYIGIGPKNYEKFCEDKKKLDSNLYCVNHPHNYYLQTLTELGASGFLFFIIFYLYLLYCLIKFYKIRRTKKNIIYLSCLISAIISLSPFMPHGSFYNGWLNTIIFFNLGIFNVINIKNLTNTLNE